MNEDLLIGLDAISDYIGEITGKKLTHYTIKMLAEKDSLPIISMGGRYAASKNSIDQFFRDKLNKTPTSKSSEFVIAGCR